MKILLVDDHVSFCEGLIAAVTVHRTDIEFSFEADAELVPMALLSYKDFDMIIVDIMMPGLGGVELIRYLNSMNSFVPVLGMSSIDDVETIQQLYSLGVLGFIPKYYSVEEIINVIDCCAGGEIHIPADLQNDIELDNRRVSKRSGDSFKLNESLLQKNSKDQLKLTKRQVEILSLMDQGLSNRDIASQLHISIATVKTHIHHLYTTFKVNNRVACLRAAKKARLN